MARREANRDARKALWWYTSSLVKVLASRSLLGWDYKRVPDVEIAAVTIAADLDRVRPEVRALAAMNERIDHAVLDHLPNLLVVANYGVGYDTIDVEACARRDVAVTNTPGVVDGATADLAVALMLASRRRVHVADQLVRAGVWRSLEHDVLVGDEVHHSTLGLVGCGRIGQAVARRAHAFDIRVLYTQRTPLAVEVERALGAQYVSLDNLLSSSDAVSLHCPLTPETRGLIGRRELGLMRDGALLVNTARGPIVDEEALVAELEARRLNACLDVYDREPSVPRALLSMDNVVLSPHLGTATTATRRAMTRLVVDNIAAAFAGQPVVTPVPGSSGPRQLPRPSTHV